MTDCRSEKIRNLIITHLGKKDLEKYDATVKACKLGNALKDERTWAPLCPEYRNLKGVTCGEIEEFLNLETEGFFTTDKYKQIVDDALDPRWKPSPKEQNENFIDIIKAVVSDKEFSNFLETISTCDTVQQMVDAIYVKTKYMDPEERKFEEDYLRHVKVYDRDEAYEAFKNIGDWIESDTPGILKDPSTIFVTTPRGGHEMLSIFAYANDIDKEQIPSDITWEFNIEPDVRDEYRTRTITEDSIRDKEVSFEMIDMGDADMFGRDWMEHTSNAVRNIFIVDDIIASGQQVQKTAATLEDMFPNANINSVTLCKRDETHPDIKIKVKNYYTDTKTTGIDRFIELRGKGKLENEYITCLFPHACPDGRSDRIMVELMGGNRCPPEKRIARKDL